MIQCSGCGFVVNETMKFALMNNLCPSCGSTLFSGRDSNLISMVQAKLSSQKFSSYLTEELSYDISLFIFNELKHGLGRKLLDEAIENFKNKDDALEENDALDEDVTKDDVRNEIEREFADKLAQLNDEGDVCVENEEIFSKADRLKTLRKQQLALNPNLGNKPVTSKRGSGFKGISRAG